MSEILQTIIGAVVTATGASVTAWLFGTLRQASVKLQDNIANEALNRMSGIIFTITLDATEVLGRNLVEGLRDGKLTGTELQTALDEAAQFTWSLMRNMDKQALAGALDDQARREFTQTILKPRIEAAARSRAKYLPSLGSLDDDDIDIGGH